MSRTFSMNSGSFESLNVSTRWGCSAKARQIRLTAVSRCAFQRQPHDVLDRFVGDLPGRAGPGLVQQAGHALGHKATTPSPHRLACHPRFAGHRAIVATADTRQHDPRSLREGLRRGWPARPAFQRLALILGEHQRSLRPSSAHRRPPRVHGERGITLFSFTISNSGH